MSYMNVPLDESF